MASVDGTLASRGSVPVFRDARGALTLADLEELPFSSARAYVLHDIPVGGQRGGHAQRTQHRFVTVVAGRVEVLLDNGHAEERSELGPGESLLVGPGLWHRLDAVEEGTVLLVIASGPYDRGDYVYERTELPIAPATAEQTSSI